MKRFGSNSHEWRALKHYWKLLVTSSQNLKYNNYWSRRNFAYSQVTDVEVIHWLLSFDHQLKQAYEYYPTLLLTVHSASKHRLKQLLQTTTALPKLLQRV